MSTIHVLESFASPKATTNPYITQLADALSATDGVVMHTFSWRTALLGAYDVFHVHWPDTILQARDPVRRFGKRLAARLLLARLRLQRIAVVRTVHNPAPHEQDRTAAWIDRRLAALTSTRIQINDAAALGPHDALIPHGDYRTWFAPLPRDDARKGRAAFVGLIRPYKGVEDLIDAFAQLTARRDDVELRIAGKPRTAQLRAELERMLAGIPSAHAHFEYITDEELVSTVTGAALTVLPYRGMTNSGMALAALSLDRPVLLPRTPVSESLQREVGEQWVSLFDGELDDADLERALDRPMPPAGSVVVFSDREWATAGNAHRDAFRAAIDRTRGANA